MEEYEPEELLLLASLKDIADTVGMEVEMEQRIAEAEAEARDEQRVFSGVFLGGLALMTAGATAQFMPETQAAGEDIILMGCFAAACGLVAKAGVRLRYIFTRPRLQ